MSDDNKKYCCPLGCGLCGGEGCGGVPISYVLPDEDFISEDVTSSDYCCLDALVNITQDCGVEGVGIDPPCLIPNGACAIPQMRDPIRTSLFFLMHRGVG